MMNLLCYQKPIKMWILKVCGIILFQLILKCLYILTAEMLKTATPGNNFQGEAYDRAYKLAVVQEIFSLFF